MTYTIMYAKHLNNMQRNAPAVLLREWYSEVNVVEANDLEHVFEIMNHGQAADVRSMSVGDVAIDIEGRWHYCEPAGWTEKEVMSLSDFG